MEEDVLIQTIKEDLTSDDVKIRKRAVRRLMEMKDSRTLDLLIEALKDSDPNVRRYAAKTLGDIGDARAVDPLDQALQDQDWSGRSSALEALRKIGNARAEKCIEKYLDDESDYIQNAAREALNILSFKGMAVRDSLDFDNPVDEKPYVNKFTAYVESGTVYCSVHRAAMLEDKVRISSGLEVFTDQVYEDHATDHSRASKKLFPNCNREFGSGCFDFGKEETLVLYCPECRKAEGEWEGEYWKDTNEKRKELEKYWAEMPEDEEGKMRHIARFYVDRKMIFDKSELFYHLRHEQWNNREDMARFLYIIKEEGVEVGEYLSQIFSTLD
jgi:hypothetical protein